MDFSSTFMLFICLKKSLKKNVDVATSSWTPASVAFFSFLFFLCILSSVAGVSSTSWTSPPYPQLGWKSALEMLLNHVCQKVGEGQGGGALASFSSFCESGRVLVRRQVSSDRRVDGAWIWRHTACHLFSRLLFCLVPQQQRWWGRGGVWGGSRGAPGALPVTLHSAATNLPIVPGTKPPSPPQHQAETDHMILIRPPLK